MVITRKAASLRFPAVSAVIINVFLFLAVGSKVCLSVMGCVRLTLAPVSIAVSNDSQLASKQKSKQTDLIKRY